MGYKSIPRRYRWTLSRVCLLLISVCLERAASPGSVLWLSGETPRVLLRCDRLVHFLTPLLAALFIELRDLFRCMLCSFDWLLRAALCLHHLLNRIGNVFPVLAWFPWPLSLIPGAMHDSPIRHMIEGVGKTWITLQDTWREVRLDAFKSGGEHLHVRDLARHQKIKALLHIRIIGELHQVLVHNFRPCLSGNVGAQIDGEVTIGIDVGTRPGYPLTVSYGGATA